VEDHIGSTEVLTVAQINSITCNNTSNNDTMVAALKDLLVVFLGESNRTQCFDHIVNLIARSIIQHFDVFKPKGSELLDEELEELMALDEDLDKEELEMRQGEGDDTDDDDTDGWVDEWEELSETEKKVFDKNIQPVRRVLVKVSLALHQ